MAAHRTPYVGTGADGARRSARMDRAKADSLDPSDPRRAALLDSATRWDDQAADLDQADRADDRARSWRDMAAEVQAAREHEQEHQWYIDRHQGWGRDQGERGHGRER